VKKLMVGSDVDWVHGEHHRIATIEAFSNDGNKVLLSGLNTTYWMKFSTLVRKINKPYRVSAGRT